MQGVRGLIAGLTVIGVCATGAADIPEQPAYPGYNRLLIPKITTPIKIDGVIDEKEWADAALAGGLYRYGGSRELLPVEEASWFYLGYDDANLYIAMRSTNFPPGSQLKTDVKNKRDAESLVMLDHFEVQFTRTDDPAAALRRHFYKFMGNHQNSFSDQKAQPSVGQWGVEWESGAQYATRFDDKYWDMEMAVPFKNMDEQVAPEDLETWILWLVRAYNCQSTDFFMWGGADWLHWDEIPRMTFHSSLVSARLEKLGEPLLGNLDGELVLVNHSAAAQKVYVDANVQQKGTSLFAFRKAVELAPGQRLPVAIRKPDLPVTQKGIVMTLSAWMDRPAAAGKKKASTAVATPLVIYQQQVTLSPKDDAYRKLNFEHVKEYRDKKIEYQWKTAYYQSSGAVHGELNLDIDGLDPKYAAATAWQVRIVGADGRAAFEQQVPVKNRAATMDAKAAAPLGEGVWRVEETLLDAAGKVLDAKSYDLEVKKYPWEGSTAGIDDAFVPPPYTPVKVTDKTVAVLNREYVLDGSGLPLAVTSEGRPLLAAPMRLEATQDGKTVASVGKGISWGEQTGGKAVWTGAAEVAGLAVTCRNRMDYDGMVTVDLILDPQGKPVKLDRLGLVMDLAGLVNVCKAFRGSSYAGGGGGLIPAEQKGVIWDSAATRPIPGLAGTFNPAIYVGNPDRGIWWFADSDQGWILDDAKSASTVERLADGHIRVNQWLVNRPATLDKPRTISFLFQAAPAKPLPQGWREVAWGPQRIWGASWADGYYTFSFDTPELWREYSKWDWASRAVYVATNLIGPAVPGFEVYAGEWTGNSDLRVVTVNHDVEKYFPDKVYKNAAGQKFSEEFRRRVSNYIGVDTVRSLVDCRSYYFDQGVKYGKLRGFWWDMDTLWPAFKPDLGFGYVRDDGTRQPGFNYRAMREMFKRLYQISYQNGSDSEHWHYADGYYGSFLYGAWLTEGFFYMFSEDVDLIAGSTKDWWPLVAGRHIASIPQLRSNFYELKLDRPFANPAPTRAGMTVCLLNDMGGYGFNDSYRNAILAALRKEGFFDPAVTSVRHWEPEAAAAATYAAEKKGADVLVTFYKLPGNKLLVVLGNMSETATHGTLTLKPAGLLPEVKNFQHWKLRDVENGVKPYMGQQHPDQIVFERVGVGGHDFRLLILEP